MAHRDGSRTVRWCTGIPHTTVERTRGLYQSRARSSLAVHCVAQETVDGVRLRPQYEGQQVRDGEELSALHLRPICDYMRQLSTCGIDRASRKEPKITRTCLRWSENVPGDGVPAAEGEQSTATRERGASSLPERRTKSAVAYVFTMPRA